MNGNVIIGLATFCLLLIEASQSIAQNENAETSSTDKQRARRLEQMVDAAADYELWGDRDAEQALKRVEQPVLRWSNPLRATDDGAVFLWTDNGRPAAALCIYTYGVDGVDHEWQSLATGPLRATYRGTMVWRPQTPGLEFHPVPGDPEPAAATPARRLSQMHRLLRDFSATIGREPQRHELRVLTQPIHRYGDQQSEIVDGAIFAFAQATDPEVLLLLEARREKQHPATWWWAAARMSMVHMEIKHRDELVWTIDRWDQRLDDRQPYITFSRKRIDLPSDPE